MFGGYVPWEIPGAVGSCSSGYIFACFVRVKPRSGIVPDPDVRGTSASAVENIFFIKAKLQSKFGL